MQTPTTTMRAWRGAAAMIWSSTPGTPTHSKTTAGRLGGPGSHGGSAGGPRGIMPDGGLAPALPRRQRSGVDNHVGAESQGQIATAGREIGGDDRPEVGQAQGSD